MFFEERIKGISINDKVLEIGPGATPFYRSDIFLEKQFDDETEYERQFGNKNKLNTDKQIVFYKGDIFPFKNNEFDYVICSHVLEHVENLELFLSEIFRVSRKGYFEYPLIYYDFLYNIDAHVNFLKFENNTLNYCKKHNTNLYDFTAVQKLFFQSLDRGYTDTLNMLLPYFMEGFEWNGPFKIKEVTDLSLLCHLNVDLELKKTNEIRYTSFQLLKKLVKSLIGK